MANGCVYHLLYGGIFHNLHLYITPPFSRGHNHITVMQVCVVHSERK